MKHKHYDQDGLMLYNLNIPKKKKELPLSKGFDLANNTLVSIPNKEVNLKWELEKLPE